MAALRIAIIVPARFASTRFPAKPLAALVGGDGKARPAIAFTWAAAQAARRALLRHFDCTVDCVIATDDVRIAAAAAGFGAATVMTSQDCANGTERCAAALPALPAVPDIVINLQGDAPLIPADMVAAVAAHLLADDGLAMATVAVPAGASVLAHLQADAAAGRVGGTTCVRRLDGRALYFSKSVIPHVAPGTQPAQPVLLHVGLYAYRPAALAAYAAAGPSPLERQEGLEQLRFVETGHAVGVALCDAPPWDLIELNNPQDVPVIEAQLARRAAVETI
jgi:3-deoxy-manno-octulosonate cytidylyltransferase (CMP-KDO synthetase)